MKNGGPGPRRACCRNRTRDSAGDVRFSGLSVSNTLRKNASRRLLTVLAAEQVRLRDSDAVRADILAHREAGHVGAGDRQRIDVRLRRRA